MKGRISYRMGEERETAVGNWKRRLRKAAGALIFGVALWACGDACAVDAAAQGTDGSAAVWERDGVAAVQEVAEELVGDSAVSGMTGDHGGLTWTYEAEGKVLTISGEDSVTPIWDYDYRSLFYTLCEENNVEKIIMQDCKLLSCKRVFGYLKKVKEIVFLNCDTGSVTDMEEMFEACFGLESLDLSGFNTENVIDMGYMFEYCNSLVSLDLSGFNTKNVTNMGYMFYGCNSLVSLDLKNFNTENVVTMNGMFRGCYKLKELDLKSFDTKRVMGTESDPGGMTGMFADCRSLKELDLSGFHTENVRGMKDMFFQCFSMTSLDLSSFNTENVEDMVWMLSCPALAELKTPSVLPVLPEDKVAYLPVKMADETGKFYTVMFKETEAIAKTAHSYGKTVVTKATLTADGAIEKCCTVCGQVDAASAQLISRPKTVTLVKTAYTYDGKTKKPAIKVTDVAGQVIGAENYSVTYAKGLKEVGSYTVTVTFKGNYSGTKNLAFTINPAGTTLKSVKAGSKKLTVKWNGMTAQVKGYEIQYSTDKNFAKKATKTVTVKKNSTTERSIKKLTAKKKYYVRIRTYQEVSGKKYYSGWSKAKSATVKK